MSAHANPSNRNSFTDLHGINLALVQKAYVSQRDMALFNVEI